jgi:CubicO group peptidase (beta-lactamase class C family)
MKVIFGLIACFCTAITNLYSQSNKQTSKEKFVIEFDAYVQEVLKNTDIPAIGISIISEGKPVFIKAYGYANKEAGIKADNNTLFYIASSTKSFTALSAVLLDKEGKIKLNESIDKYMGSLQFRHPIPAQQITIKHLLTHTAGLTNDALGFRMAYSGDIKDNEIDTVFTGAMTYADSMFNKYNYDNLGYNIYAVLLRRHLKANWKDVLATKIFKPTGMNHTTAYMSEAVRKGWNVAAPYQAIGYKGAVLTTLPKKDNNLQSAGGIFSSPNDLAKWIEVNMNKGKIYGKQVFAKEAIEKCQTGYTAVQRTLQPFTGLSQYGLGWVIGEYKKEKVIYHFGGFPGYSAHISFMPDKKTGVAITTNESNMGSRVAAVLATFAYDWWLNEKGMDTIYERKKNELKQTYETWKKNSAKGIEDRAKRPSKLTLPLNDYAGEFINEFGGTMKIFLKDSILNAALGNMQSSSTFFTQDESIRVELIPGSGEAIKFIKDENNKVTKLVYSNFEFTKIK